MDNKFSKNEIILLIIIVIDIGISLFIGSSLGIRSKYVFFALVMIEFGIFCVVQRFLDEKVVKKKTKMRNSMQERFDKICDYCNQLEDADYDIYKIFPPISKDEIENWERENQIILPKSYKEWLLLSDGFEIGSNVLYPLNCTCKYPEKEGEEHYIIESYIGDGSILIIDNNGTFYKLDHVFGIKESTFESFLDEQVIKGCLKDGMKEMGLL